jgi:hypothetical protein
MAWAPVSAASVSEADLSPPEPNQTALSLAALNSQIPFYTQAESQVHGGNGAPGARSAEYQTLQLLGGIRGGPEQSSAERFTRA